VDVANGEERAVTLHHHATPSAKLLILFDGETWRHIAPHTEAALGWRDYDIVIIDNVGRAERGRDLPIPENSARLVEQAIREAEKVLGVTRGPELVVVAGQSYGGLAAAAVAVKRPDLASRAIAQSGSYWFQTNNPRPTARTEVPGDLLKYVEAHKNLTGRVIVQVGSDEMNMVTLSRQFSESAQQAGMVVTHDEWRGGHDYAWWRHGLSSALDMLERE
jgi:enterochelin esterase family protein